MLKVRRYSVICLLMLLALGQTQVRAEEATGGKLGHEMAAAAKAVLAGLSEKDQARVMMKFDDPARLDWHNIPKPTRKGVQLREMNADQQKLVHKLLEVALSKVGYEKAARIMSLENNLFEGEKPLLGSPIRDPQRYFLSIFGKPENTGEWGWSFEGHHFSLNFAIKNGEVVADTPSFFGANPATVGVFVTGGPEKGTRTLANEEQYAFDLVNQLTDEQRKKAIIDEKAPADYRAAGAPTPPPYAPEGIAASDLTDAQKKTLWSLLETYNANLAPELTAARLAEVKAAGVDKVYFAWAGSTMPGVGHYYRVQGPTFVLELVNIQADPQGNKANHIHSVWRSETHDFGIAK